jgi:hypothetical protein
MKMRLNKVSGFFMAFTIAMSLTGLTYAHWSDNIKIEGKLEMAHIRITIISYKALTSKEVEKYSEIDTVLSEDGHLMTITCTNLKPCWFVWIGLVTQNQGSLPANVKPPEYIFEGPDGFHDYFETEEYFYGPYPENTGFGNLEVWGKVRIDPDGPLRPDGTVTLTDENPPPFPTDPGEKTVIWIWIHCEMAMPPDAQGKTVTLYVRIVDDMAV